MTYKLLILLCVCIVTISYAQNPERPVQVTEVYNYNHPDGRDLQHKTAGIGDIIVVKVANLKSLMVRSKCKDSSGNALNNCQPQAIMLFINGRMVNNIKPISGFPQNDIEQ